MSTMITPQQQISPIKKDNKLFYKLKVHALSYYDIYIIQDNGISINFVMENYKDMSKPRVKNIKSVVMKLEDNTIHKSSSYCPEPGVEYFIYNKTCQNDKETFERLKTIFTDNIKMIKEITTRIKEIKREKKKLYQKLTASDKQNYNFRIKALERERSPYKQALKKELFDLFVY